MKLGVIGTAITGMLLSSREDRRLRRESIRTTCADFTAAIARMRFLATQIHLNGADAELTTRIGEAHEEATVGCERLRLVTTSMEAQEAARYALRYGLGLWLQVQGRPPRPDETERSPLLQLNDRLHDLYVGCGRALRRNCALPAGFSRPARGGPFPIRSGRWRSCTRLEY